MKLNKICICGHFGFGQNLLNGQTIKTKIVAEELDRVYGNQNVIKIDTAGGIKALPRIWWQGFIASFKCKNIITLLSDNGLKAVMPAFLFYKLIFHNRISHLCLGAELARYLKRTPWVGMLLHKVDCLYAETNVLKNALNKGGYEKVNILPNCKSLNPVAESELKLEWKEPYKLCMFARVMKEKGVEDACNVIKAINKDAGRMVYTLDIYGQVDSQQNKWFDDLQKQFTSAIKYGGIVPFDKSVDVLKNYFALLFPTKFYVEGVPGTIIDAYASGLPVISSKWESFTDVIDDKITGYGYEFDNVEAFKTLLVKIANNPEMIISLKTNCLKKVDYYSTNHLLNYLKLQ